MPITFEVVLQDERIKRQIHLGFRASEGNIYPFVLQANGTVDFGSDYQDSEIRYIRTNIMDKIIQIGELFTMDELDEDNGGRAEFTYRIQKVERM